MAGNYIQKPNGQMAGSIGEGRDDVPQPSNVTTPTPPSTPPNDLLSALANLPGITVTEAHGSSTASVLRVLPNGDEVLQEPADLGAYTGEPGRVYWDSQAGRCGRCDGRYCTNGCFAGEPGWVYVTGRGYLTYADARKVETQWQAAGVEFGPTHGLRRVEWRIRKASKPAGSPAA